ncbi:MAG: CPCC family cysteine-rich protein [Oscillospiraceae bacterium]
MFFASFFQYTRLAACLPFREGGHFDICPVCKWENDGVQNRDHSFGGGANELSVEESRLFFEISKDNTKKDRLLEIKKIHKDIRAEIHEKYRNVNYRIDGDKVYDEFRREHLRYINEINQLAGQK